MRPLARLLGWAFWVVAFFTFVFTFVITAIFAGMGRGALEASLCVLVDIAFVAAAIYLRSRPGG
jgi:hypothetical protein